MSGKRTAHVWALLLTGLTIEIAQASGHIEFSGSVSNPTCQTHSHLAVDTTDELKIQSYCAEQDGQSTALSFELRDLNGVKQRISSHWNKQQKAYRVSPQARTVNGPQVLTINYH